jgi:sugar-specific transcriptional regulator TrmB
MRIQELIEFGLSQKEAEIYLSLLQLEIAEAQEISTHSGINRSTTYVALDSLLDKGLVKLFDEKNLKVKKYIVTSPDNFIHQAKDRLHHQENVLRKLQTIVPDMKAIFVGQRSKPIVKVFEGKEGIIEAFGDILSSVEKVVRVFSSPSNIGQYVFEYIPEYIEKRSKAKIIMLGIHPDDEENRELVKNIKSKYDEHYLVPTDKFPFPADLAIYDNKIGYMTGEQKGLAIIIESKEIAGVMKSVFDLAFEQAKKLDNK